MKNKLITRLLLITLCMLLAVAAFAACDEEAAQELETYKNKVDELESNVSDNTAKLETLETKEVVAELKALAESIKTTADAAATQTALAEAITALEAADSTKATAQALADAKAALEASLKANGDADAATKTAIEEALAQVKATADAAATAAALEEAIGSLEASDIQIAYQAKTAIGEAKTALEAALKANSDADAAVKAEIDVALSVLAATDVTNASNAAQALEAVKAELSAADTAAAKKAAADLAAAQAALTAVDEANKAAIETAIAEAVGALDAADIKLAYEAKTALGDAIVKLEEADATNKAALEEALASAVGALDAADIKLAYEAKTALGEAVVKLEEADAANKAALEEALASAVTALETADADLLAKIEKEISDRITADEAAAAKVEQIKKDLEQADKDNKAALEKLVADTKTELEGKIAENKAEIAKTNTALANAVAKLEKADKDNADAATKALNEAVKTLNDADTKVAADAAAALNTAKTELTAAYTNFVNGVKAELAELIETNAGNIGENKTAIENLIAAAATKAELAEEVAALNELINGNKTAANDALTAAKAELNTAITNLKNGDVAANASAIAALESAVDALEATYSDDDVDTAIADAVKALKEAEVAGNTTAITTINQTITTLQGTQETLAETVAANKTAAETDLANAIAGLENGAIADNTALITGLQTALNNVKATADAAATAAAFNDAKSALEAADAAAKTAYENADAELTAAYKAADTALTNAYMEADTALDTAYKAADEAIKTRLSNLETNYDDLSGKVTTLETKLGTIAEGTTVAKEIADIKTKLEALGTNIQLEVKEFVDGFELVTKILQGTATVADFTDDADLTAEGAMTAQQKFEKYGKYTLTYFSEKVNEVKSKAAWYKVDPTVETDYNAFLATEETVRFYLTRATSVESLEGYFADFDAAYDSLPTPAETFELAVSAIENKTNGTFKGVTADPACYATAESIYNNIVAINSDKIPGTEDPNTDNDIVLDPALVARYENIKAACTNLAAAIAYANDNVKPAIEAIDATIIWTDACKAEVTTARNAYYTLTTYFANTTNTDLYDETTYTAELLAGSTNVTKLTNAEARVAELTRAFAKVEGFKTNEFFEDSQSAQPLYTKLAGITALETAVTEWIAGETGEAGWTALEDENIELMLGEGVFANIAAAQNYAEAMDAVNTEHDAANAFENEIKAMNEKTLVLYTDKAAVEALRVRLNALITAVDGDTANLNAIIPADTVTAFEAVEAQMVKLHTAFVTINGEDGNGGLKASITGTEMSYYNSKDVEQDLADIFKACDDAGITYEANPDAGDDDENVADPDPIISYLGDANFDAIAANAIKAYDVWMEGYRALTAKIAEVYVELAAAMAGEYTLADGNKIITTSEKANALNSEFGVANTDIDLVIYVDENGYNVRKEVNLKDVITNWNTFRGKFMAFAAAAQEAAIAVKTEIDAIAEFDATNLNKYEQIVDTAYKAYTDWADTYLNGDYSEAAIDAVQAIEIYGGNGAVYTFVTSADYDILVAKKATADTTYTAADEAFTAVAEKLNAVNTWTIYDYAKFTDAKTAYASYVETYYKNEAITANEAAGLFGEVAEKADFDVQNTAFHAELAEIAAAAEAVKEAINAATETTVDATNLNNYEQIKAAFDAYVAWDDAWLNSEAGYVRANLEAIVAYTLDDSAEVYAFVTLAELDAIQAAYTTATATYDAANDAFADIKADFDALDSWTIYNGPEFTAAFNAYAGYVTTYYKDEAITANANAGLFGEVAEQADLNADYVAYHETLAALEIKAADAVAQIQGIAGLSALDLDNYAQITAAWAAYEAWVADTAVVADRLGELENIEKTEGVYYVFVTAAQYAAVKTANDTAEAQKTASVNAWADVVTAFDAVANDWVNIHNQSKFDAADTAYKGYLTTYYETTEHADIADYNGEIADINAYLVKKGEFETNLGNAQSDKNDIDAVIDTLAISNITVDNASDYVTAVADLKAAIDKYADDYGCDLNACAICGGISADDQLAIAKAEKLAAYAVLCKAQLDLVAGDAEKTSSIEGTLIDAYLLMADATFDGASTPDSVYDYAVSILNDLVASWNTVE